MFISPFFSLFTCKEEAFADGLGVAVIEDLQLTAGDDQSVNACGIFLHGIAMAGIDPV